jgi:hypothetical protein
MAVVRARPDAALAGHPLRHAAQFAQRRWFCLQAVAGHVARRDPAYAFMKPLRQGDIEVGVAG